MSAKVTVVVTTCGVCGGWMERATIRSPPVDVASVHLRFCKRCLETRWPTIVSLHEWVVSGLWTWSLPTPEMFL